MRQIRIAAFAAAAILACVAMWRIVSIDPAPPARSDADFDSQAAPAAVPPPPPEAVPEAPVKKHPAHTKVEPAAPGPARQDAPVLAEASAIPEVLNANDPAVASAPAPELTASADHPTGPVIVVPRERPKQPNRGMRWLKAVGHALHIGGPKDPAEQAFQN